MVLILYFGFILLRSLAPGFLTQPISATSVIPVGMLVDVGVILGSIVLTASTCTAPTARFDPLIREIIQESAK